MNSGKFYWIAQRITALILMPLTPWFVYYLVKISNYNYFEVLNFFESLINSSIFLITLILMIYHGLLGMQTIIDDYINSNNLRNTLIFITKLLSYLMILISTVSIVKIQIFI